jgi:hypothetical protein
MDTFNPLGSPLVEDAPKGQPRDEKPEEFSRFEVLTSELIKVPKKELDEKRKASE